MVGNIPTNTMQDFALAAIQNGLSTLQVKQGDFSFAVQKVEPNKWSTKLVVYAEIGEKEHKVNRQYVISLMPN